MNDIHAPSDAVHLIRALGIERDLKHVDVFIQTTRESDPLLRAQACSALGWLRHHITIDPLIDCVADDSPAVRHAALSSLMHTPTFHDVELLCTVMSNDNAVDVRARAARAIGYLKLNAVQALRQALKKEKAPLALAQIVYALGRLKCIDARSDIHALHTHSDTALKIEVMRALTQFRDTTFDAVPQLTAVDPLLRIEAIRSIAQLNIETLYPLVKQLMGDDNPGVRCAVLIALREADTPESEALMNASPLDPHPEVRRHQSPRCSVTCLDTDT